MKSNRIERKSMDGAPHNLHGLQVLLLFFTLIGRTCRLTGYLISCKFVPHPFGKLCRPIHYGSKKFRKELSLVFTSPRRSSAPRGGDKIRYWFIVCQEPSLDVTLPTLPTSLLPGAKTTPKTTPILLRLKRAIASCTTVSSCSLASATRCHRG